MGLPHELLPFAENFYRRFPEEFVALGMPGLEQVFDLRADGSRSRKIFETPTEKKVEITIRRWETQPPSLVPPAVPQPSYGYPSYGSMMAPPPMFSPYGYGMQQSPAMAWPPQVAPAPSMPLVSCDPSWSHTAPPPSAAPPAPNATEVQMTAQLTRLETALSLLKPQIEAAVKGQQAQAQAPPQQHQRNQSDLYPSFSQSSHSKPVGVGRDSTDPAARDRDSPPSSLRSRRNMAQLQMESTTKRDANANATIQQNPPVKQIGPTADDSQPRKDAIASPGEKKDKNPPPITAVRMLPSAMDPESPRSPGKFSVWK